MAGGKNNTITYEFEGNTVNLEEAIDRLASRFKKLHKENRENTWDMYEWEGSTKNLYEAYEQLGKSVRGVRQMLKRGQGTLTKQDKEDLKNLRNARKSIEQDLANAGTLDNKGIEALQKKMNKALRIAHRLRKRSIEVESKYQLAQARKNQKLQEALSPQEQAAASLNIEQFDRLKKYADLSNPAEKAFIDDMTNKVNAYNSALNNLNAEKERQKALTEKTSQDEDILKDETNKLAEATRNLNDAYNQGITNLRKMSKLRNQSEGRNIFKDFSRKLYSQSLRQIAASIISTVMQGIKGSLDAIAKMFEPFNEAMSNITSSIKYMFESLAAMIAPIVQMLAPVLTYVAKVIARVAEMLARLFSAMAGNEVFVTAKDQVDDYAASLNQLKKDSGLDELNKLDTQQYNFMLVDVEGLDNLKSVGSTLDSILKLVTAVTDPLMNVLEPILTSLAGLLAAIMTTIQPLLSIVTLIGNALGGIVDVVLVPILNFVATMLNNLPLLITLMGSLLALWAAFNWSTFIGSLQNIIYAFVGIAKAILGAVAASVKWIAKQAIQIGMNIKSAVSAWIAEKAYWKLAIAIVAAAGVAAAIIAGIVLTATASASSAANSYQGSNPATVALAAGGVVAAPTLALVGEGKYPEAVVPLGQSPQFQSMKESIAQEVVNTLNIGNNSSGRSDSSRPVILNIDGKTLARALWPNLVDTQYQVGVKLK